MFDSGRESAFTILTAPMYHHRYASGESDIVGGHSQLWASIHQTSLVCPIKHMS
ncbi:AGAP000502-PA-like protein [Anopheles sinensis]|uniref:AGAP000502-PA-like protein n=1 Tax=Anopheles sinensis TaxID=74873 RepID=A0A084VVJ7_ANOSI|nr:AGAP000502-PA-like protein [Anopheles sinensis]